MALQQIPTTRPDDGGSAERALATAPCAPGGWRAALWALVREGMADGVAVETAQATEVWTAAAAGVAGSGRPQALAACAVDSETEHRLIVYGARPPALRRATALAAAFDQGCRMQSALEDAALRVAADHLGHAHFQPVFCRPDGGVLHAPVALDAPDLRLDGGRLKAVGGEDQAALRQALRRAAFDAEESLLVLGRTSERPTIAQIRPALPTLQPLRALAVVVVHGRAGRGEARTRLLRRLFGLTQAEALVAAAIGEGARVEQIAETRGVAGSTVRAQIKTILAKVGVGRQLELVQRLADLA